MTAIDRPKPLTPAQMHALDILRTTRAPVHLGNATGWSTGAPTIATGSAQVLRSLGLVLIDNVTGQVALTEKGRRI